MVVVVSLIYSLKVDLKVCIVDEQEETREFACGVYAAAVPHVHTTYLRCILHTSQEGQVTTSNAALIGFL